MRRYKTVQNEYLEQGWVCLFVVWCKKVRFFIFVTFHSFGRIFMSAIEAPETDTGSVCRCLTEVPERVTLGEQFAIVGNPGRTPMGVTLFQAGCATCGDVTSQTKVFDKCNKNQISLLTRRSQRKHKNKFPQQQECISFKSHWKQWLTLGTRSFSWVLFCTISTLESHQQKNCIPCWILGLRLFLMLCVCFHATPSQTWLLWFLEFCLVNYNQNICFKFLGILGFLSWISIEIWNLQRHSNAQIWMSWIVVRGVEAPVSQDQSTTRTRARPYYKAIVWSWNFRTTAWPPRIELQPVII